jgi:hypothetical protein
MESRRYRIRRLPTEYASGEDKHSVMKTVTKKLLFQFLPVLAILAFLSLTALFHGFGPYHGRVVDAITGEPLAGAVILVRFETCTYQGGEIVNRFADAVETATDQNGNFSIPSHRVFLFRPLHQWLPEGMVLVCQPGYGCFPKFKGSTVEGKTVSTLPENERATVRLPRLETPAQRKENLSYIYAPRVPEEKMPRLLQMKRIETNQVNRGPVSEGPAGK